MANPSTPIKPEIERLESLLAHSPLPSVKGAAHVVPYLQIMLDQILLPIPGAQYHSTIIALKLKNDEGFPVTLTMPNQCSVIRWVVEKDGKVIDHSPMCTMQYDPVQKKLAAKYTDREFHTINLERAKYETGKYTLKVWFWGVPCLETKFFVEKLGLDKLSKEAQTFLGDDKATKEFVAV
ncbi:MAG: hypothetical protein Q8T09_00130 [Candidatus Melainabacteria bacterium]|nr:hypothetical protein [Candidatus Melainabacteria bacterium]